MCKSIKIKWNIKFILIVFLFPGKIFSQDIAGVWVGHIYNDTTHKNIHYELAINQSDGKASGYSHTTFVFDSITSIGVKSVKIKIKKDRIEVVDEKFIYDNFPTPPPDGVKMYSFLTLSQNDSAEVLSGNWMTNSTKVYNSVTGTIFLEKKKVKQEETVIVTKLIQLGLGDKLSFLPPAIASGDLIAINSKPNLPKTFPSDNNTSATTPLTSQNEEVKKPQQIAGNEKQNQNVTKVEEANKNEVAVKENIENKKPKEPVEMVKKEPVQERKNENKANPEDINQKQTAAKVEGITATKESKLVEKNEPPQVPQQQKSAASSKVESVNAKEVAIKESNEKNQAKEQVAHVQTQQKQIVQTDNEKNPKPENLNKNEVAVHEYAKKNEPDQPNAVNNEPANSTANEQIIPKTQNENRKEVTVNGNQIKSFGPPPAAEISKRKIETIRTVDIISKDSLQFSLYDNGTVDGDTVTVLINGKVVMPRVGLLERAINKTIYLTPDMGDSISVVMYAENLGSIPPNTGLLVIRDANKIYEIRFSGDLQKNSAIILVRKKKT